MRIVFLSPGKLRETKSKVQAGDEQQAVLRVGGTTSAQKGN